MLVWRVWVVWSRDWRVIVLPILTLLAGLGRLHYVLRTRHVLTSSTSTHSGGLNLCCGGCLL